MDPKNISNLQRAGSLGNPQVQRTNSQTQPIRQPEYRSAASLNINPLINTQIAQSIPRLTNNPPQSQNPLTRQTPQLPITNNQLQGEFYDNLGESQALLTWSILPENQNLLIEGSSDYNILSKLQNILLAMRDQFLSASGRIVITGGARETLDQRMILLESEINGLMRRKINFAVKDTIGGHRVLDYTNLLNQKENQIVELQKKINNLEERLRRAGSRQQQLENHIQVLTSDSKRKDEIIRTKNDQILAQVSTSNQFKEAMYKLKKNMEVNKALLSNGLDKSIIDGVNFPDFVTLQIRPDALNQSKGKSLNQSQMSNSPRFQYRNQLITLFREFQRLNNSTGITESNFQTVLQGFLTGLKGSRLQNVMSSNLQSRKLSESIDALKLKLNTAINLYRQQILKIRQQNPSIKIDVDKNLLDLMQNSNVTVNRIDGGTVFMERYSEKTIEVPVQDSRTKHLIHLFASELKRLSTKYPKLLTELDVRLTQFFQQQLIDLIEVDEIDRLVQIVKYVPQVVKVQNVYAYSNQKSRKVQFHLRVLIKVLLQQIQKLKNREGIVLNLDEGVIGMINSEIMGIVNVDDILKVFRVVPKIVEVQKIVQKIVDRVIQIPEVIPIQKIVEKIIEVEKIKQVQKIVNIPLQIPTVVNNIIQKIVPVQTIVQKVIQVPTFSDKIVQITKEVSKIVEVQVVVEKVVEVQKVVEIERQVNHFVPQIKEVIVQVEKIVAVQKIVQKIVQVPTYVQKIVERVIEIPQIIQIQKIVQKIVEKVEYRIEKQMIPYTQVQHKIVEKIVQKPIVIIQREEKIIQTPQIIQKIIEVRTVQQQIKEVEVIRDNIIIQERIKEIQKQVPRVVTVKQQIEKVVERRVEIPIIVQKIVTVPQIVTKPIIQKIQNTIIKEVSVREPLVIKQPVIVQIQKPVIHYVDVTRVVKHFEQKIIQVPKHIQIIKEVRVNIDKIIQKMVEVPKVVEVEKVVQKIVVVPRVIEKIIQIPQIVQVPVERVIIQQKIKEIQKIIQVPVFEEKIVQVEVQKNVYIEVEKVVDRIVEKVVQVPKFQQKIQTVQIITEKVVQKVVEVPRQIEVQKIVTNVIEREHIVEIDRPQVVPVQIRYPVEKIIERLVPVYQTKQIIQQVPQIIQKVIEVKVPQIQIREVQQVIKEVVVDTKIVQVPSQRILIQDQIREVQIIKEKPIPIVTMVQEIVTAERIVQKVVQKVTQIPKVYQVQKIVEKVVESPQIVQIETLVPQLIRVKEYIQNVVEKIVQVPLILERIKQIQKEKDRIVEVQTTTTQIKQVERIVQKTVILQKFKETIKNINHIEQVLQIVDRYEQQPVQIHSKQQKLVQVPYILEKIVEKVVVMPQIVQVLKYVHEVVQKESLGVAVGVDVATHEQNYKLMAKNIQANLDLLIRQLNLLSKSNPALQNQIDIIFRFLTEFHQFILYPTIVQIPQEKIVQKIVQKDNIVQIPVQDERSLRMQLTLSLLVQKLILQLKRLCTQNRNMQLKLDEDISLIFFRQLNTGSNLINQDFNNQLKAFSDVIQRKFQRLGNWTVDHQVMLNSFLQERFMMANLVKNANLEIEKAKSISEKRLEGLNRYRNQKLEYQIQTKKMAETIPKLIELTKNSLQAKPLIQQIQSILISLSQSNMKSSVLSREPIRVLQDLTVTDDRVNSLLRTKDAEIVRLREQLFGISSSRASKTSDQNVMIALQNQNTELKNQISQLRSKLNDPRINAQSDIRMKNLNQQNYQLQEKLTSVQNDLRNTINQYKTKLQIAEADNQQLKVRLSNSSTITFAAQTPSRIKDSNIKSFDTPDTGARRSQEESRITSMQSSGFNLNSSASSVSAQSNQSQYNNRNPSTSNFQTMPPTYTRYSTVDNPYPSTTQSNITENFQINSTRFSGPIQSGESLTYPSGFGNAPGISSSVPGSGKIGSVSGNIQKQPYKSSFSNNYVEKETGEEGRFSGEKLGRQNLTSGYGKRTMNQTYGTGSIQSSSQGSNMQGGQIKSSYQMSYGKSSSLQPGQQGYSNNPSSINQNLNNANRTANSSIVSSVNSTTNAPVINASNSTNPNNSINKLNPSNPYQPKKQ